MNNPLHPYLVLFEGLKLLVMGRARGKKSGNSRPTREKRAPGRFGMDDVTLPTPAKKPKRSLSLGQVAAEAQTSEASDSDSDGDDGLSMGQAHQRHLVPVVENLEDQVKRIVGSAVSAAIPEVVKQVVAATSYLRNPSGLHQPVT